MEQLNNLDVVFLVIIGISALVAIARGVTKELLSITGWLLAAVSVYYLGPIVDPITKKYVVSDVLASLVSSMGILVMFCIFWVLAADKISMQIRFSKLSSLDRILGFIFGIARGVLIVILLNIMITSLIPDESQKGIFAESRYFQLAGDAAEPIKKVIPEEWFEKVKEKSEQLGLSSSSEEKSDTETSGEPAEDDKSLEEKAGDVLKNSGEALFEKLAQPKPESEADEGTDGYQNKETSDLDHLMDVLEDNIVTTDKTAPAPVSSDATQKVIENTSENPL